MSDNDLHLYAMGFWLAAGTTPPPSNADSEG